ncbi:hypothetical protein U0035_13690 [Niabella yanshanensis]|uniref:Uncharacterized protein n=1 Tax=Niabella yanshanensis TaxID=577386 RepID=A0ABZ0W3S0_9BACT|nr:hypothetical protein [Niabella yanshanensis]WQD36720.1 hypothetical protein U0035_13690 [Niabella yanshanensis]
MKKTFLPLALVTIILLVLGSCKKNESPVFPGPDDQASAGMMQAFFDKYAPKTETFSLDASAGGTITLKSGTKITFPANAFVKPDGSPVAGSVRVSAKDILKASDMILANKPTVTSSGEMLESFGEIIVNASRNDTALRINPAVLQRPPTVMVPVGTAMGAKREAPMWEGDTTVSYTNNGFDHENQPTSVTVQYSVSKGIDWNQIPGWGAVSGGTTVFPLDALGQWRNCDALYNDPNPKTTVLGYFGDKFNGQTGTGGQTPSMLFFKKAGTNTLINYSVMILNPAAGKEGFLSYQNSMPIGTSGTFLAMSAKNGKFYAELKDVTFGAPVSGKDFISYSFSLSEVSETQLLNLINLVNTK